MKFHLNFKFLFYSAALIISSSLFAQNLGEMMPETNAVHSASKPILLFIRILSGPDVNALTYTGRWVYVKDGQDFNVEISDKTNRFLMPYGDYVKSCEIRRTSTNEMPGFSNWFYFQVIEGGTNVFESPELTNEDSFVYQRK